MFKVKFTGEQRENFSWISMGKAVNYSFGPNEVREVAEGDLPYLLSFGKFSALEATPVEVTPVAEISKIDPFITVTPQPVPEPVVAPVVAPVVEAVEEVVVPKIEEDRVDYTSYSKKDLVKLCKERKLATIGNRDDLIARLVTFDNEK